jgi:hypothetical protein
MNNNAMAISTYSFALILLAGCSTQFKYQEEPAHYPIAKNEAAILYLELAFPVNKSQQLALQLALVKHKKQAAKQERWLLLHQVPYQWVWVEWKGEQLQLLAAGPFKSAQIMMDQRRVIQQWDRSLQSVPAIALLAPNSNKGLSTSVLAENSSDNLPNEELKEDGYPN